MLHAALYTTLAFLGWLALVASVGVLIHGRAWVWERTREAIGQLGWRLRRRRRMAGGGHGLAGHSP